MNDKVYAAAIKFDNEVLFVEPPGRHYHVIQKYIKKYNVKRIPPGATQGFILNDGTFVDRIKGAKIAIESGQIEKLNWPPNLYSEDLW